MSDFLEKYLRKRLEPGLAPSGVRVSFMSSRLQAVLPGVFVPGYSSVRDGWVRGATERERKGREKKLGERSSRSPQIWVYHAAITRMVLIDAGSVTQG